jgi:hypothetical protein
LVDGKSKSFFLSTADRWLGYMTGNRSKHNWTYKEPSSRIVNSNC